MNKMIIPITIAIALIAATAAQAGQSKVRLHRNFDNSVLIDSDENGQRLVLPEDYHAAQITADNHYAEMNPDSVEKLHGRRISISYDVAPGRILPDDELNKWAATNATSWWQSDLLRFVYRNIETMAVAHAAEDPERAEAIVARNRAEERIPEPPPELVKDLAWHRVTYSGKAASYDGQSSWRFQINGPGLLSLDIPVPVGSSEKAIMEAIHEGCLSDSRVRVGGERIIVPRSKEMLSWVRW
jgi:hypothetical protein